MATHDTLTLCPFVKHPFSECVIKTITGSSIPQITRFCMADYPLCPVYQKEHGIYEINDACKVPLQTFQHASET
ncbi:MAG: hypothetical protein A2076_10880 [Geobacteraceae bacterium GWC2_53_11]|nr:MAG: hypothetical protein A2076_10880 [Geobacteraceae bacterium GWC2_53_11]